jgi:cobalt transporter subunit CbtA
MLRRIFWVALIAGSLSGLFAAAVQQLRVAPLIEQAEAYEAADSQTPPPAPLARLGHTVLADILAGIGFAMVLSGAIALAGLSGHGVDLGRGLLWGAAGFTVFTLAPALHLPPSLPGMAEAALPERQVWWAGTVLATALGLAAIVFCRTLVARLLGAGLTILPQAVGAPAAPAQATTLPPELAAQFAVASIATAALFWLLLGGLTGWLYRRLDGV